MSPIEYQFIGYSYNPVAEAMHANPIVSSSRHPTTAPSKFEEDEDEEVWATHDEEEDEEEEDEEEEDWDWEGLVNEEEEGEKKPLTAEQKRIKDKIRQHLTRQADKEVGDVLKRVLKQHHTAKLCIPVKDWGSNKTKVKDHGESHQSCISSCTYIAFGQFFSDTALPLVPAVQRSLGGQGSGDGVEEWPGGDRAR